MSCTAGSSAAVAVDRCIYDGVKVVLRVVMVFVLCLAVFVLVQV
jgi:hypothetical protein